MLAFRYVTDPKAAKPYLWPLDVAGLAVTRSWPMEAGKVEAKDHIHQRSAWSCHGDVISLDVKFAKHFRDVKGVDFWSERKGHGRIVCTSVKRIGNGVETTNYLCICGNETILSEKRSLTLLPLDGTKRDPIVFDIDLHADRGAVVFADTKEGSLGVRAREEGSASITR